MHNSIKNGLGLKPRHTAPARKLERVVFALAPESRAQFFPYFDEAQLPPADYHWIDFSLDRRLDWEGRLEELKPNVLVTGWGTPAIPDSFARETGMPLRYLCHLKGTIRSVVPRHLIERGVLVSNWGPAISYSVAEHALLLVMACLRNQPLWNSLLHQWPVKPYPAPRRYLRAYSLRGRRVGLHGFGSVARELVQMLRPFNVSLAAYSEGVPRPVFEKQGVTPCATLEELFSQSDIVIECEALTSENRGSVNEAVLRCLPPEAVFVNVGRGQVVDQEALVRVASEGNLRIGIDVYDPEPLSADSGLHQIPGAILSPHVAGPTDDAYTVLWDYAMSNLHRYLTGAPIEARITLDIFDRST